MCQLLDGGVGSEEFSVFVGVMAACTGGSDADEGADGAVDAADLGFEIVEGLNGGA